MVNIGAFEQARKMLKETDFPFLSMHRDFAKKNKPYEGLHILHNIPLTFSAVLKIEPLILGGADVTMSCITLLEPKKAAIEILKDANVKIQIEHDFKDKYDFCMDCCGELLNVVNPSLGASELTKTGSDKYKNSPPDYPVISVDDSELKLLETFWGTSEAFIRAISTFFPKGLQDINVIVFGYGKIGTGIVSALLKFTENISVVEIDKNRLLMAKKKGVRVTGEINNKDFFQEFNKADLVVTTTGVKNVLSDYYDLSPSHFKKALLANMGAEDEFGHNFPKESVLFDKRPLNFMLEQPTATKYLDPILYAHNISLDLILSKKAKNGYNKLPVNVANSILSKWCNIHDEEMPKDSLILY